MSQSCIFETCLLVATALTENLHPHRSPHVYAVFDVDHDVERAAAAGMAVNGFSFEGTDGPGIDYALNR